MVVWCVLVVSRSRGIRSGQREIPERQTFVFLRALSLGPMCTICKECNITNQLFYSSEASLKYLIITMSDSIKAKLIAGNWEFDDLPLVRDESTLWSRVQTACSLTDQELSRLKNTRCPPPGNILFHPIPI
jgi:hypothetical protein